MPTGELDPDNPNVVTFQPAPNGTAVDVAGQDVIDVELFGAAGQDGNGSSGGSGGNGGRVIGRGYDVSDQNTISLYVADGRQGRLAGGAGGTAGVAGGDGGGLTAVVRSGTVDLAAHGGGGGAGADSGGGGGAAGGAEGRGTIQGDRGDSGQTGVDVSSLGGDGGFAIDDRGISGRGEVVTNSRVESSDVFFGEGRSAHAGLARIRFSTATSITITNTNSPVKVGDVVQVTVEVINEGVASEDVTVELEVEQA